MKQTIQIRRTETRTYQLEVPQPLTRETLAALANERLSSLDPQNFGLPTGHTVSQWSVSSATPECECQAAPSRVKPRQPKKGR